MKIVLIILGLWLLLTVVSVLYAYSKVKRIENYQKVQEGMNDLDALRIMGNGFTKESFPKYDLYEWKINSTKYKGVNKVRIKIADGKVKKVEAFRNM